MHPRTEDLLSVRDGDPVDAAARARMLADPECAAEIERLRGVQQALRALPALAPPADAWDAIAARLEVEPAPPPRRFAKLVAGAAIAATVAIAAVMAVSYRPSAVDADAPAPTAIVGADPEPQLVRPIIPIQASYASLVEESVRLERMLSQLPQRSVIRAGTASTIAGLEDRITLIDAQLMLGSARGLPSAEKQALWRERVDLMNALVHVRYAQAENGGF